MDLRTGTSVWTDQTSDRIRYPALNDDIRCEVLILGGGISGALIGHQLAKEETDVVLIDRRDIGCGSTAASTGLLQYEIDTPLVDLIKLVGERHAVHAYRRGLSAIDEIEVLVSELDDDCGFTRRDTLYFASEPSHEDQLKNEFHCRREHGFDVDFLSRKELARISSIDAAGAIRSRGDAQIDPFRFTQTLMRRATKLGLRAFTNTIAEGIDEQPRQVIVRTNTGTLVANKIIYATGYETQPYLSSHKGRLQSTYAVASVQSQQVSEWPDECLIWETARPYFYARRTADGRSIIGGSDTEFAEDHAEPGIIELKTRILVKRFCELFPDAMFTPEYAWAGTFAETKDGLAYIGQPGDRPRAYFALGYGGNGITFSVIAAKLLTDLIAGRPNSDANVFRFGR